jgi:hypothetical protein
MHAIEILLELLVFPAMIICTLCGIGLAVLVHWLMPSAPIELEASIVAIGFAVGFLISWSNWSNEDK